MRFLDRTKLVRGCGSAIGRLGYPRLYIVPQTTHLTCDFGATSPPTPKVAKPSALPFFDRFAVNWVPPHFGQATPPSSRWPTWLKVGRPNPTPTFPLLGCALNPAMGKVSPLRPGLVGGFALAEQDVQVILSCAQHRHRTPRNSHTGCSESASPTEGRSATRNSPQCLHFLASARISSAHHGHLTVSGTLRR